jgi:hypothetical protein
MHDSSLVQKKSSKATIGALFKTKKSLTAKLETAEADFQNHRDRSMHRLISVV